MSPTVVTVVTTQRHLPDNIAETVYLFWDHNAYMGQFKMKLLRPWTFHSLFPAPSEPFHYNHPPSCSIMLWSPCGCNWYEWDGYNALFEILSEKTCQFFSIVCVRVSACACLWVSGYVHTCGCVRARACKLWFSPYTDLCDASEDWLTSFQLWITIQQWHI